MTQWLHEYVLVRLQPLDLDDDMDFSDRFGIEVFPWILLLDPDGKRKLGECGDVAPDEVAATLRKALGR